MYYKHRRLLYTLCLSTLLFLFSGCAHQPYGSASTIDNGSEYTDEVSLNSAVLSLTERASSDIASENYNQAEAKIERALRIEPTNAALWLKLAQIAQKQSQYEEAKNLAERALTYTSNGSTIRSQVNKFMNTL